MSAALPSEDMDVIVRLRRGFIARNMIISVTAAGAQIDSMAVDRVLHAFVRAVNTGMFGPGQPPVTITTTSVAQDQATRTSVLEGGFPRLRPDAFAVLPRMVRASVPGASRLEIRERGPHNVLLVRDFERDCEVTIPEVPWQLSFPIGDTPGVLVTFREPIPKRVTAATITALQVWAEIVTLGGFPGEEERPSSSAKLDRIEQTTDRSVGLRFNHVSCAHEGVEVLFEMLCTVNETASIESVEVVGAMSRLCGRTAVQTGSPVSSRRVPVSVNSEERS